MAILRLSLAGSMEWKFYLTTESNKALANCQRDCDLGDGEGYGYIDEVDYNDFHEESFGNGCGFGYGDFVDDGGDGYGDGWNEGAEYGMGMGYGTGLGDGRSMVRW